MSEKIEVSSDMLSKYCKDIADQYRIKVSGVKKLIPNLGDKVHYKNLKYYLSLGIKLVNIHRILSLKIHRMLISMLRKDKKVLMNLIKTCTNC